MRSNRAELWARESLLRKAFRRFTPSERVAPVFQRLLVRVPSPMDGAFEPEILSWERRLDAGNLSPRTIAPTPAGSVSSETSFRPTDAHVGPGGQEGARRGLYLPRSGG
jgi:hypothetical protein